MVEIEASALRDCVRLTGGNVTGIFIHEVIVSRNSPYVGSLLRPGLKLNKVSQRLFPHNATFLFALVRTALKQHVVKQMKLGES